MTLTWQTLSGPVLTAIVVFVACGLAWFLLQPMWVTLLVMIGGGAIVISTALQSDHGKTLTLGYFHLALWFLIGGVAAIVAILACLSYNEIAGTDKTPWHIAQISAAVFSGPMAGPVANPGGGRNDETAGATLIMLGIVAAGSCPFVFVRRKVSWPLALLAWVGFLVVTVLWFLSALASLAFYLS